MKIEVTSFYPHGANGPEFDLQGSVVRIKVGVVPRANVAALFGEQEIGFSGDMGSVLLGVAIRSDGTIVEWREIPIATGITEESNSIDWEARLQAAMQSFQEG